MTSFTVTATGGWTPAADLPDPAGWYGQHDGAVVLDDTGTVLVAGGADGGNTAVRRATVFDTDHGWRPVDPLQTPRRLHTATLLQTGKVLVTGGTSGPAANAPALMSAELFNPADGSWSPAREMTQARAGHSAVLLPDGSVLVAGGSTVRSGQTTKALRSAERYIPKDDVWIPVGEMTDARTGHTAVVLTGGKVLVCGGTSPVGSPDDPALAFCELYNPDQKTWAPTGSLARARRHHQATPLSDSTVLVTGGTAPGVSAEGRFDPFSQRSAELYELTTGLWRPVEDMPSGRAFHRAVPFGTGQVLVIGGAATDRDEAGYRSAVLYDGEHWSPMAGLDTGRWAFAVAVRPGGQVLVTGGVARSGLAAADPGLTELTPVTELLPAGAGR